MSLKSLFGGIVNDSPVPLVSRMAGRSFYGGNLFGRRQDIKAELTAFTSSATLYGVVTKLGQMTSMPDWHLCRKPADPEEEPIPLTGAQADRAAPLMVLKRPNSVPFMTRAHLFAASQQHRDLVGEMYWVLVKRGGIPVEIWPVRPDRMFPVPSATKLIAGYIYRSPDGEEVPLRLDDVLSLISPSSLDPMRGQGPVGALAADLAQSDAQSAWNAATYRNSANPGGVISFDRRLSDDEWDEFVERWRMQHQGVQNAGRVAVLENATFTPISYSQKDMQFAETRQLTRTAIFDAYGFPKFGIGDVDDVNRASAEASLTLMAQTLTVPRLNDWRDLLNDRFLPMFGPAWKGYCFEYDSPIPPDAETERLDLKVNVEALAVLVQAGFDADEAAEVCRLPVMKYERPEPVALGQGDGGYRQSEQSDGEDVERNQEKQRLPRRRRREDDEEK